MTENARMDVSENELQGVRQWASKTASVKEIWLFGSRATGRAKPDSDTDLAIELMPSAENMIARGHYERFGDEWQFELAKITSRQVSLELMDRIRLWARGLTRPSPSAAVTNEWCLQINESAFRLCRVRCTCISDMRYRPRRDVLPI